MKIITISGRAGSGKDTVAEIIQKFYDDVLIVHCADYLKFACEKYLHWDGVKDEKGRQLLQQVGTDIVRKQEPNFWVGRLAETLDLLPIKEEIVVIADARFPNEIDYFKLRNQKVAAINIIRPNLVSSLTGEQLNHESENALYGYRFDRVIINDSTLEYLELCVGAALANII